MKAYADYGGRLFRVKSISRLRGDEYIINTTYDQYKVEGDKYTNTSRDEIVSGLEYDYLQYRIHKYIQMMEVDLELLKNKFK